MEGVGAITTTGVTATGNDPGILISGAASFTDTDGNYSGNNDGGIFLIDIAGNVSLTRTIADNNDADNNNIGDGLRMEDGGDADTFSIGGTLTLLGTTFRDTDGAGNATWQERGVYAVDSVAGNILVADSGVVTTTITGNDDDGFDIDGTNNANIDIRDGVFSNNGAAGTGTGIEIDNADFVTVTNVTASNNGSDGLDVDPTDVVSVVGGIFNNNFSDGIDLDDVSVVAISGSTVANNNGDDGVEIDNFTTASISFLTTNNNGDNGVEIATGTTLGISNWVTQGNNGGARPGNQLTNITTVNFQTTTVPSNVDDKVEIFETDFQHTRALVMQDFVGYTGIGTLNFFTLDGMDVYVINENVSNPANAVDINLDGGTPSAGPNAIPGDKLVMAGFGGTAAFTNPATGTGVANNVSGNAIDFTDIEDIVVADNNEFNNTLATATVLGSDMAIITGGSINSTADEDFFKVTAKQTGVLQFNLFTMFGTYMDLDMDILDADGDLIASSASTTDNEFVAIPVVAQKMYHVRVYGKNNGQGGMNFGNYDLEIENTPLAITPQAVHLDPTSDTGMMANDNYTADNTPTFIIQADLAEIVDPNNDGINDINILTSAQAAAGNVPGVAVWVTITNSTTGVSVSGFADQIGSSSLFSFTSNALGDGVFFITSAVQIFDGSTPTMTDRGPLSVPLWFTIDTAAPVSPTTPDLLTSSDSFHPAIGTNTDNITNVDAPAFDGFAEPNSKVRLFANGRLVGQTVATTSGIWEITSEPLADGNYVITAESEDLAGNISQLSQALNITVDTLPPQRPTIDLVDADDSGMSNMDNVTNDNTAPVFRVSAEPGSWVVIKDGETVIDNFVMPGAGFTFRPLNLAEGPHPLSAEAFDAADNRSAQSHELLVTIDTVAPATPGTPDLLTSSDTGMTNNDNVTNKMRPTFSGTGVEPNAKVRIYANNVLVGQGTATSFGSYEISVDQLADGVYNITTELEDLAGNISARSAGLTIVVDTEAPNTPYLDLLDDTGHSATDNITADNTPRVSMTSEDPNIAFAQALFQDNLKFRIYDRYEGDAEFLLYDSTLDMAVFNANDPADVFTALTLIIETLPEQYFALNGARLPAITAGGTLADGVHNLKLEVEDRAGNISHDFLLPITIDTTTLPVQPPVLLESSDTGMLNDDMVINEDEPAFMGVAEANAIVRIYARDVATGTVQLVGENVVGSDLSDVSIGGVGGVGGQPDDGYGLWEITVEPLDDATYDIFVEIEDWAGNIIQSEPKRIWVDTVEPNTPLLDLITDSGRHDADNITNDNTPTFEFTVNDTPNGGLNPFPNDIKYRLYLRPGNASGEILVYDSWTANGNNFVTGGFFTHTIGAALNDPLTPIADGVYDFKLEVEDRAGNISHDFLLNVTIDTQAPPKSFGDPAVMNDGLHPDSDTGVIGQPNLSVDRITSDATPQFTGRAEADSIIRLFVVTPGGNVQIGQTVAIPLDGNQAFPNGEWSITSNFDLNDPSLGLPVDGVRQLVITAEDVAGNVSRPMQLDIFLDTAGPVVTGVTTIADPAYNLFAPKPNDGPTPLMRSIDIAFSDLPARVAADFVYAAVNGTLASEVGNYSLVGDTVGNVAIVSAAFIDNTTAGNPGDSVVRLFFSQPLEDDRYTLTVSDTITDDAGNALDGESNAVGNTGIPNFIGGGSGDGTPGGDFVARFTVDSRPEIAVWGQSGIFIDANQTYNWETPNALNVNYDLSTDMVFNIGVQTDQIFAGQFKPAGAAAVNGYDRIGAYGLFGGQYRFLLDFNDNGVIEAGEGFVSNVQANALPVAGNFDGNAANGDEIGLFDGKFWYLDTTGDNLLDTTILSAIPGLPVVGDFDGDGQDDLAAHVASSNTLFFDLAIDGFGNLNDQFSHQLPGVSERPFAADFDQDGIDDIGLTTKNQEGVPGQTTLEWYIFRSGGRDQMIVPGQLPANLRDGFSPTPLGNDLHTLFGNDNAVPVVGNFDPPAPAPEPIVLDGPGDTTFDTTPTTTWNIPNGATGYEVLFYESSTGQLVQHVNDLNVLETSFTPENELNVGSTYQLWVRPIDLDGRPGSWAAPVNFEVVEQPLAPPTLTGPSGTSPAGAVTITWTGSDNATGYDLLVYNISTGQQADSANGVSGTSYDTALGAGIYQVFARATNATQTSGWSSPMQFELTGASSALAVPTLTGPTGSVGAGAVNITWNAEAAAADYELLIYNINTGQQVANLQGLTGTSQSVNLNAGDHQVFLRASDGAGTTTAWSTPLEFTVTGTGSTVPTLTGPAGTAHAGTVTITWTAASSAATYELLVYNISTGQQVEHAAGLTGTSHVSAASYVAGSRYQVFVRAVDGSGNPGAWATPLEFDVVSAEVIEGTNLADELLQKAAADVAGTIESSVNLSETVFTAIETDTLNISVPVPVVEKGEDIEAGNTTDEATSYLDSVLAEWDQLEWWNAKDVKVAETVESTEENSEADASLLLAAAAFGMTTPVIRESRKRTPKTFPQQRLQ
ncbi:MAG: hypothetical protein Tsb009_12340 [Planctomycetaceae bacterium]